MRVEIPVSINISINKALSGGYLRKQRVFINVNHDRCICIEKISLCGRDTLYVSEEIWDGNWNVCSEFLCHTQDEAIRKIKDVSMARETKRRKNKW